MRVTYFWASVIGNLLASKQTPPTKERKYCNLKILLLLFSEHRKGRVNVGVGNMLREEEVVGIKEVFTNTTTDSNEKKSKSSVSSR